MKRRLNFKGKVLLSSLTAMLSVGVFAYMAHIGGLVADSTIYLLVAFCGWGWLLLGQIMVYLLIWGEN